MQVAHSSVGDDLRHLTSCQHPPPMQDNKIVVRNDLVEQVSGPQYPDALLDDQPPHVTDNIGPRFDVETDSGFVKQQEARPV